MKNSNKKNPKNAKAEEIAKIMVANMQANMNDPNFLLEKERKLQKAADKVLKKEKENKETE